MNAELVFFLYLGCIGAVVAHNTCEHNSTLILMQGCVNTFNTLKNDPSGNYEIKCDAAKTFQTCISGKESCLTKFGFDYANNEAKQITSKHPCSDVQAAGTVFYLSLSTILCSLFISVIRYDI